MSDTSQLHEQIVKIEGLLRDDNLSFMHEGFRVQLAQLQAQVAAIPLPALIKANKAKRTRKVVNGDSVVGDKVGEKIGMQINIVSDRRAEIDQQNAQGLRNSYLQKVLRDNNRTPQFLAGLGKDKLQLSAVYTALITTGSATEPTPKRGKRAAPEMDEARRQLSALAQIDQHQHCVLLGGPGSGKSTFVNFVAACMAGECLGDADINLKLLCAPLPQDDNDSQLLSLNRKNDSSAPQPWRHSALIPVQVTLRNFAATLPAQGQGSAKLLWNYIEKSLQLKELGEYGPHLKHQLMTQGGLILLDGLDEVPDALQRREQVKGSVQDFVSTFSRCRFLVTSRTYAYERQDWKLRGFDEATLRNFSLGQIDRFVTAWYTHVPSLVQMAAHDASARAETLKRTVRDSQRVRELAERPLLLTLIARLQTERGEGLPKQRQALYERSVDMLLNEWESYKVVEREDGSKEQQASLSVWMQSDQGKIRRQLERLAFEAHHDQADQKDTADIPEDKLVAALVKAARDPDNAKTATLRDYLRDRAGILSAHGEAVYQFPHRTFQEYLAACHLTRERWPRQLSDLLKADPTRWREATLLAAAKAKAYDDGLLWDLVEELVCHPAPLPDTVGLGATAWGALIAGQILLENDLAEPSSELAERFELRRSRVRGWMLPLMRDHTLPAAERALAGRALAKLGDTRREVLSVDAIELLPVPAGEFWMGAQKDHAQYPDGMASDDEGPLHRQFTDAFAISRYPITQAQFAQFVAAKGYETAAYWGHAGKRWQAGKGVQGYDNKWRMQPYGYAEAFMLPNAPVVGVTWFEAVAFTHWLTQYWRETHKIGQQQLLRLPTEAEWEKAARGMQDARRYPWGDDPNPNAANYADSGIGSTSVVGCFSLGQTPFGCEDMSGNVWEWTLSKYLADYNDYANKADVSLQGEDGRVLRGGSFAYSDDDVRAPYRSSNTPDLALDSSGFRVVFGASPLM